MEQQNDMLRNWQIARGSFLKQNAITLGNMYEKDKVLKIALPSGGSLHVNVDSIDKELETIHEALLEKEEKQSEKEQEERIRKLFEDRNANEEMTNVVGA